MCCHPAITLSCLCVRNEATTGGQFTKLDRPTGLLFIQWVVRGKLQIIHILHHVKVSQALLQAYTGQHLLPLASRDGSFPAILQVMWHLDPLWLAHWPASEDGGLLQNCSRNWEEAQIEVNFVIFGGIDKLIFWSHYVLKQLIGRLLLCGICHIMVNLP